MKISFSEMKKGDMNGVVDLYSRILHPSYISYGEITEGLAVNSKRFSKDVRSKFKKYIIGSVNRKNRRVLVARADGLVAGFVCVEIKKAAAGHLECWISDLGVDRLYRRSGIARKLIKKAKEWGKKEKAKYYFLESGHGNSNAHRLFESEGFSPLNIIFMGSVGRK